MNKIADDTRIVNVIYNFFKHFETWCGPSHTNPAAADVEKFFSKNLQMFHNGELVVKGGANYFERVQMFKKMYSNFKISAPLEKPLINGNQACIYYQFDLTTPSNQHKQIYVMGLFTIEEDKISRWVQVTHEKGSASWVK